MTEEIWKVVDGFDHPYEVSNLGRARGPYGLLMGHDCGTAMMLSLIRKGRSFSTRLHTLVAQSFVPNPDGLPYVRHKDGDITNCRADNLEWVSSTIARKEETEKKKPAPTEVPVCPKNCIHSGMCDTMPCCDYIFNVGHPRPCPPGPECTVYEKRKRKKRSTWNDGKRKEDGNV